MFFKCQELLAITNIFIKLKHPWCQESEEERKVGLKKNRKGSCMKTLKI